MGKFVALSVCPDSVNLLGITSSEILPTHQKKATQTIQHPRDWQTLNTFHVQFQSSLTLFFKVDVILPCEERGLHALGRSQEWGLWHVGVPTSL